MTQVVLTPTEGDTVSLPRNLLVAGAFTLALVGVGAPAAVAAPPYANCTQVWEELGRPIYPDDPGYTHGLGSQFLDGDDDGVGCETRPAGVARVPAVPRRDVSPATTATASPSHSPTPTLVPAQLAATGPRFPTAPAVTLGATLVLVGVGAQVLTRRRTGRHAA